MQNIIKKINFSAKINNIETIIHERKKYIITRQKIQKLIIKNRLFSQGQKSKYYSQKIYIRTSIEIQKKIKNIFSQRSTILKKIIHERKKNVITRQKYKIIHKNRLFHKDQQ